ncbi:hypothetical protein ACERK3_09700 [Phycisphaerales bacterium AB-hyl4]|uniref:Uncharacterized protein n=1 Tax=Natronomicrosphaera hydrolytica TaxID=3242702 RepID=A0ABV4U7S9_9BACT
MNNFTPVTNDKSGESYAFRRGVLAGIDTTLLHIAKGATAEQLQSWRAECEAWADGGGWPSPPPALADVEGGEV